MRMELIEGGCPSEIVDSWIGHAYRGEEPWGKFSSFDYSQSFDQLERHLTPIIKSIGLHKPVLSTLVSMNE